MSNPYQLGIEARKRNSDLTFNPYWKNQKERRWMWELGWLEEDWKIFNKNKRNKDDLNKVKEEIFMSYEEVLREIS